MERTIKTADNYPGRRKVNIHLLIQKHNQQVLNEQVSIKNKIQTNFNPPNQYQYLAGLVYPKTVEMKRRSKHNSLGKNQAIGESCQESGADCY